MLLPFCLEFYRWQNGRTQFAPTVGIFIIDLEFAPQQCLLLSGEGGPRQRWMRCWDLTDGKKQQYRRAGACSCRLVWNLINGEKRETPGEGFPLALRAIHPSCALRTQKGVFRSLRRATKGAAFGIRHPLKRVDRNFIIWCGI